MTLNAERLDTDLGALIRLRDAALTRAHSATERERGRQRAHLGRLIRLRERALRRH